MLNKDELNASKEICSILNVKIDRIDVTGSNFLRINFTELKCAFAR